MSDSESLVLLTGWTDSTEALKNAFADSKFAGVNVGLLPLSVDSSDHVPSISDCEQ